MTESLVIALFSFNIALNIANKVFSPDICNLSHCHCLLQTYGIQIGLPGSTKIFQVCDIIDWLF